MTSRWKDLWAAPVAAAPVNADLRLPGSKSLTNRALILAALAAGPSRLGVPLRARDTTLMAAALRSLGTRIDDAGAGGSDWHITPDGLTGPAEVDCGLAGTVMRFVPPVAALADGPVDFDGDAYARERPMGTILGALRTLGTTIEDAGRSAMPFTVHGAGSVAGGSVEIDASASSQFVSALLLAGARYDAGVTVHHVGKPVPSVPHIAMTVSMLRQRGVVVDDSEANTWRVEPGTIQAVDTAVEPDLSNAAPFLAAAALTGGRVRVLGWPAHTDQPGDALREIFGLMGAHCRHDDEGLTLRGGGRLDGVDIDLHDVGELTPVVAAVAACGSSPSYLRGIAHLRFHETDRLAALASELNGLGGDVTETEDGLEIRPRPLHGGVFHTYADHRMAHAGAVLGLVVPGVEVEDIATTTKTLPDFAGLWHELLGRENVA